MKGVAFCDGRGNSGTGACGAVLTIAGVEFERAARLGPVTNNVAEYKGVMIAMQLAFDHKVTDLEIFSDSQLIVQQLNGKFRVKDEDLKVLRDECWVRAEAFENIKISWVRREENTHADRLCRQVDREPSPRKNPFRQ